MLLVDPTDTTLVLPSIALLFSWENESGEELDGWVWNSFSQHCKYWKL